MKRAAAVIAPGYRKALEAVLRSVEEDLAQKEPGDVDFEVVQHLKRIIRESEACAGIEALGLSADRARFLDLPFYRTGKVRKNPVTVADVAIMHELLEEVRPSMVFAAGDLSDPHGTHRMCLETVERALDRYSGDPDLFPGGGARLIPKSGLHAKLGEGLPTPPAHIADNEDADPAELWHLNHRADAPASL